MSIVACRAGRGTYYTKPTLPPPSLTKRSRGIARRLSQSYSPSHDARWAGVWVDNTRTAPNHIPPILPADRHHVVALAAGERCHISGHICVARPMERGCGVGILRHGPTKPTCDHSTTWWSRQLAWRNAFALALGRKTRAKPRPALC